MAKKKAVKKTFDAKTEKAINEVITTPSEYWAYEAERWKVKHYQDFYTLVNSNSDDVNTNQALPMVRMRMKALWRNSDIVKAIILAIVSCVIPRDFCLSSDIPGEQYKALNDKIEAEFKKFAKNCDANGDLSLNEMANVILSKSLIDGDCFGVVVVPRKSRSKYKTKVRLFDAEQIQNPSKTNSDRINLGIEKNEYGQKTTVYIQAQQEKSYDFVDEDGLQQVLQVYDPYAGISIGRAMPLLTASFEQLLELDRFKKSEVLAAWTASQINLIYKSDDIQGKTNQMNKIQKNNGTNGSGVPANDVGTNGLKQPKVFISTNPGEVSTIRKNDELSQFMMTRPTNSFAPFVREILIEICASVGLSAMQVFHTLEDASHSGARSDNILNQVILKRYQDTMIRRFFNPIKEHFLLEFFAMNKLDLPEGMDRDDLFEAITIKPPAFLIMDLNKELQASAYAVEHGFSTHQLECQKYGHDFEAIFTQLSVEQRMKLAMGILLDPELAPLTPGGEISKPPGSGPGRIAGEGSTLS